MLELLDAGINVFTTLNVQHVESRADAVRQITGVAIRETVPDSVLDGALESKTSPVLLTEHAWASTREQHRATA